MATITDDVKQAIELLPVSGEMPYEDWQNKLFENRLFNAQRMGIQIKAQGVNFRVKVTENGNELLVSRGVK